MHWTINIVLFIYLSAARAQISASPSVVVFKQTRHRRHQRRRRQSIVAFPRHSMMTTSTRVGRPARRLPDAPKTADERSAKSFFVYGGRPCKNTTLEQMFRKHRRDTVSGKAYLIAIRVCLSPVCLSEFCVCVCGRLSMFTLSSQCEFHRGGRHPSLSSSSSICSYLYS